MPVTSGETPLGVDSNTRWMKRVLLPFWVIRCILMVLLLVIYIAAIAIIKSNSSNYSFSGASLAAVIILIVLLVICLGLDITSMIMLARHSLKPKVFLIFQAIETMIWVILLVLEIIGAARSGRRTSSALGWILILVLFLSFLGLLIYASVIYHRTRKQARRGNYTTPVIYEPNNIAFQPTNTAYQPSSGFAPSNPSLAPSNPFDNQYQASVHSHSGSFEMRNEQRHGHQQPSPSPAIYQPPAAYPQAVELPATRRASERYA